MERLFGAPFFLSIKNVKKEVVFLKQLIMINGTMGVGKSATSRELMKLLPNSVFLDGDWCWEMSPFVVNEETKAMVMDNIAHLLNNFLACSIYDYVIFCWVMHEESIVRQLRSLLKGEFQQHLFSLVCSQRALVQRLFGDVAAGIRRDDIIDRSVPRLENYRNMDSIKIDVTNITPLDAAQQIADYLKKFPG